MTNFIFYANPIVTLVCVPPAGAVYSLETAAHLTGVHPALLEHYCQRGLLGEQRAGTRPVFDDDALYDIRRIEHCRHTHGANRRSLSVICELWREIERLRTEVRGLRRG